MAETNALTGLGYSGSIPYPTAQPMQPVNPLAQIGQLQQLDLQNQALQQGQANLGFQRVQAVNGMLGTLITKPDLSYSDVTDKLDDMVRNKIIPPDEKPAILQHLQGVANDPEALRGMLKNSYIQTLDHASKMGMGFGTTVPVTSGVGTQVFRGDPMRPGVLYNQGQGGRPTNFVAAGTSPSERNAPATMTDPAGNTTQTTVGARAAGIGQDPIYATPLTGAFPGPGKVQGLPGPSAAFQPSLEAYNADMRTSSDLAKTIRTSSQALQLADALGTTGTGPGTKPFNDAKAFLESVGITAPNDAVSMRNELDKYLQQTVNNSPLAQRSDMGTLATKLGTPNTTEQTNAATRALLRTGIAQAGMDATVPHAYDWQSNGGSVAGYIQHKGGFTQNQDQQAYALAQGLMKPDEAKALLDKMNALPNGSAQKQKFFSSLANAKKAGLVNLPNAGQ